MLTVVKISSYLTSFIEVTTSKHNEIIMLNKQNKKTIVVVKLNVSLQANMLTLPDRLTEILKNKPLHLRLMSNGSV